MKLTPILLALSVVVNLALATLVLAGLKSNSRTAGAAPTARQGGAAAVAASNAVATDAENLGIDTWTRLESPDLHITMERLREAGFPPAVVRALMAEMVRMQFAPRRIALNLKEHELPFWMASTYDPKTEVAYRQITKDQEEAIRALLGRDPSSTDGLVANLRRQLPGLTEEKVGEIARIQGEFDARRQEVILERVGNTVSVTADYMAKRRALDKEQHDALARVLGPAELEDYDLRLSNTASSLRSQLSAFDATEQEFRTLFRLNANLEELNGPLYAAPSPEEARRRSEAQRQYTESVKAALGEQRYAEYERATDGSYRQVAQLAGRLGLPSETANHVYQTQKDTQQQLSSILSNPQVPPAVRNEQLAALVTATEGKLAAALGARGFAAYNENNAGRWLQSLRNRANVPPRD